MSYPRFQASRAHKFTRATANISCNTAANTWDELAAETGGPGTGGFDLTLAVQVGDTVLLQIVGRWSTEAVGADLDFYTRPSGSNVNLISGGNGTTDSGPGCWQATSGVVTDISGLVPYTIVLGDISATGLCTFRPVVKTSAASNKTLAMSAASGRGYIMAWNIGPQDPN